MLPTTKPVQRLARDIASAARPWRVFALLLVVAVSYLALTPAPPQGVDFGWDKMNHLVAFTALAFSACLSYPASRRTRLLLLCGLLAYGGSIELLQMLVPNRSTGWDDLLADAIGIAFGAAVAALVLRAAAAPSLPSR
jgi:VanZ family protein